MYSLNINQLTHKERLNLIERLWESLCEHPTLIKLTKAQRNELDHRLDDLEHESAAGIPWDEVVKQIKNPLLLLPACTPGALQDVGGGANNVF